MSCRFSSGWRRCSHFGWRWKRVRISRGIGHLPGCWLGSVFFPNTRTHLSLYRLCWCSHWLPALDRNSSARVCTHCSAYSPFAQCLLLSGTSNMPGSRWCICDRGEVSSTALVFIRPRFFRFWASIFWSTRQFSFWPLLGGSLHAGDASISSEERRVGKECRSEVVRY